MEKVDVRRKRRPDSYIKPKSKTLLAANEVLGLLAKLAGLAAGLTVLGLITGWQRSQAYYSTLGAPWGAWFHSPADLIKLGGYFMVPYAAAAIWSVFAVGDETVSMKALRRVTIGLLACSLIALAFPESWIGLKLKSDLSLIGASATALSAGTATGLLVGQLAIANLSWNFDHLWLLTLSVALSLWQGPSIQGRAQAELDASTSNSKLPQVTLTTPDAGNAWRVVSTSDKGFLLMKPSAVNAERTFRIASASEIAYIQAVAK